MTHEFKEIITAYSLAYTQKMTAVMATVVDVDGSSYRRPGVGMLLLQNGQMTGAVSGGCVEKEIWRQAQSVFNTGIPKIMMYDGKYRLGCEGLLYILIEPFSLDMDGIAIIQNSLAQRISFVISSQYSKNDLKNPEGLGSNILFDDGTRLSFSGSKSIAYENRMSCFSRTVLPCFQLVIVGIEHDAMQLCRLASMTGWEVVIVGSAESNVSIHQFPEATRVICTSPEDLNVEGVDNQTAIVLMNHNFAKDLLYLKELKNTKAAYIGLLGPAKRREKLLSAFVDYFPEVTEEFLDLIHGPAGLNLGAETPQEIAISIIAEILAITRGQQPTSLQEKKGAIHDTSRYNEMNIATSQN